MLVVNNPGCGAQLRAERLGVDCIVHDHRQYTNREDLDSALVSTFEAAQVDGVVMAGWMRIVTPVLIGAYQGRLINVSSVLTAQLPRFGRRCRALKRVFASLAVRPISSLQRSTPDLSSLRRQCRYSTTTITSPYRSESIDRNIESFRGPLPSKGRDWRLRDEKAPEAILSLLAKPAIRLRHCTLAGLTFHQIVDGAHQHQSACATVDLHGQQSLIGVHTPHFVAG